MITKEQYEAARHQRDEAEKVIQAFGKQSAEDFKARWERFENQHEYFTDSDLRYAAGARCQCGAGLAYPKDCGINHQWTCSAVLKGTAGPINPDIGKSHEAYPFAFYEIKSEDQPSAYGATTRPTPPASAASADSKPTG